jgi:transposase-like protein
MRRYYSPSFKQQALDFYNDHHESDGWTAVRVAKKYNVNANTLRAWIGEQEIILTGPKPAGKDTKFDAFDDFRKSLLKPEQPLTQWQEVIEEELHDVSDWADTVTRALGALTDSIVALRKELHGSK